MEGIEIISRKIIKPSSATSAQKKIHKLSFLDQIKPSIFSSVVFFYTPPILPNTCINHIDSSNLLQNSLSKTLVYFYPFAGQLNDDAASIECNDQGAHFVEAQINSHLLEFLKQPNPTLLNKLLPTHDPETRETAQKNNVVLLVQLTVFNCGGIAVGVSVSHKIADASTLVSLVRFWTAVARSDGGEAVEPPEFKIGPSLLPALTNIPRAQIERSLDGGAGEKLVTKRLVFDFSKLADLKAKIQVQTQLNLTNVELVSAIVYKCAAAASRSVTTSKLLSVLVHTLNLRKRMVPPLPENAVGNLIWAEPLVVDDDGEGKMDLAETVVKMRKGLTEFSNEKANKFKGQDGYSVVFETFGFEKELLKVGFNAYSFTSWCKFPFYEMDFGWGKPIWVASGMFFKNIFILLDTKCGEGIEAWLTLEEKQMAVFETHEDLLAFASFNPSVIII